MGINKAFVVKNSLEVSTDLIFANADTRRVGIATTNPQYTLDVAGGIGATDFYLTGIGTFVDELNVGLGGTVLTVLGIGGSVGIGTALPAYLLDIRSPVLEGQTALYVQGDVEITGDIRADDIIFDDAEIQDLTVTDTFIVAGLSTFNSNVFINAALNVSGISTLGSYVDINNSVDIADDLNVGGATTISGYTRINNSSNITGNIIVGGIGTIPTFNSTSGTITNLLGTNVNYSGIGTINTLRVGTQTNKATISYATNTARTLTIPNVSGDRTFAFIDQDQTFTGTQTFNNLNVTGIATIASVSIVGATLSTLTVTGTSILGITSTTQLNVSGIGTIATLNSTSGTITNLTGTAGTIATLNSTSGTITNLTGTAGTITNLNSTRANLTNISGTNLNYSGIGTINTLIVGTQTNKATISYATNTARTLTIPSLGGNRTFAFIDQDQTFTGTQTFANLNATGVSTLGNVRISSGIVTATSGIITYFGDGSKLQNIISGIGINSTGFSVGTGVTILNFIGIGNTFLYNAGTNTIDISISGSAGTQIVEDNFTVTAASQSLFTLSTTYESGYIDVYVNGVRLSNSDYVETSSSSITLNVAAVTGDNVDVIIYKTSNFVGVTSVSFATTAFNANNINISATTSTDTTTSVVLVGNQSTGNQTPFIDSGLQYNANTNILTVGGISTVGGTSNQFLKADGSVDSTSYTSTGKAIAIAMVFGG
jgi:hypothetical protein